MEFDRLSVPNLTKQLRDRDRDRFRDPNDDRTLPRIFAAYIRHRDATNTLWVEYGVVRLTQRLTCKHVERVRRNLKLDATTELKLVATPNRDPSRPPKRQWTIGL